MPSVEKGKTVLSCSCGYVDRKSKAEVLKEKNSIKEEKMEIHSDVDMKSLPLTKAKCEKCGNEEARYWLVQTRAGDEPETKFLRCTKCMHTWRDYS